MPNRIIKESICSSDTVDGLSWFEECFFYRLIVNCDDYGRADARAPMLKARLFPLKNVTDKQIDVALQSLRTVGIVDIYFVDGRPFLQLRTWEKHQRLRAKRSKFPAPNGVCTNSPSNDSELPPQGSEAPTSAPVIQSQSQSEYQSQSELAEPGDSPMERLPASIKPVVEKWLDYKREKHQAYKPTGLNSFIAEVINNCAKHGTAEVARVIEKSMASNYQGITWDWLKTAKTDGNIFFDMMEEENG